LEAIDMKDENGWFEGQKGSGTRPEASGAHDSTATRAGEGRGF
jgi:hypothetical protein